MVAFDVVVNIGGKTKIGHESIKIGIVVALDHDTGSVAFEIYSVLCSRCTFTVTISKMFLQSARPATTAHF